LFVILEAPSWKPFLAALLQCQYFALRISQMPTPRVFLGANGFPAACYKPILQQLSATAVEYNHALIPGKFSNWHPLVDAVVAQVEKAAGSSGKVNGVGHSAGGALLCCAASVRPDLFEKVVIVDSPMFSEYKLA